MANYSQDIPRRIYKYLNKRNIFSCYSLVTLYVFIIYKVPYLYTTSAEILKISSLCTDFDYTQVLYNIC